MIKVAVTGAAGRMGKTLIEALSQTDKAELTVALEHPSSSLLGADAGECAGVGRLGVAIESDLAAAADFDVLIDFTAPAATIANAEFCVAQGKAMVIGTTGFDADQQAALLADSERLRKLINELRSQSTALDGKAFARAKGNLPRPLAGKVRHQFGKTRVGTNLQWRGIDIAGEIGATVTAVFRGQVVFSDWLRGFGLITIVDHGDGFMSLYGHADTLLKNPGDWVEGGEAVARAGNSGGSYEPGIYFELRHKGAVENPASWLAK